MSVPWFRRVPPWVWLTFLTLAVLLPGTASLPLLDRDEPRFATATREMMERHDWIVPTFNGDNRFDKPILIYWLMRAGYAVAGVDELGARLPSIASGLALVLLTAWTGRRWLGRREGWLAGAALATCLQFFIHGRLALADMLMVACVAAAQLALGELLTGEGDNRSRRGCWWLLWGALGAGFLAKGPIAWAVPALSLLLWRLVLWRRPAEWSRLKAGRGLLLALAMVAAWGVPALLVTHGDFFRVGVGKHVVERGIEGFNGRGYSPLFYLMTAPLSLFPWVVALPLAWYGLRRRWSERTAWLAAWAVAPYAIFTAYATQLPHYVLPGFPALMLLVAAGVECSPAVWRRVALIGCGVLVAVAVGGALFIGLHAAPAGSEALQAPLMGACVALAGLAWFALGLLSGRVLWASAGVAPVIFGAAAMGAGLRAVQLPVRMEPLWRDLPADTRFVGARFSEPSLVFYSGRHWEFTADVGQLESEAARQGPLVVVALKRQNDPARFWQDETKRRWGAGLAGFAPQGEGWRSVEVSGFNLGRTRWQELTVWIRER